MADAIFRSPEGNYEEQVVEIYASWLVGASGAVTSKLGGGVASVTKNVTAGNYTVVLSDRFNRLLSVKASAMGPAMLAVLPEAQLIATSATYQASFASTGALTVQFISAAGVAANPDSGATVILRVTVRNSTVGPWDV